MKLFFSLQIFVTLCESFVPLCVIAKQPCYPTEFRRENGVSQRFVAVVCGLHEPRCRPLWLWFVKTQTTAEVGSVQLANQVLVVIGNKRFKLIVEY
jgi:hypothetical protein